MKERKTEEKKIAEEEQRKDEGIEEENRGKRGA